MRRRVVVPFGQAPCDELLDLHSVGDFRERDSLGEVRSAEFLLGFVHAIYLTPMLVGALRDTAATGAVAVANRAAGLPDLAPSGDPTRPPEASEVRAGSGSGRTNAGRRP